MSRALTLDFLATRPALSRAGLALLAAGAVTAIVAVAQFRVVTLDAAALETRIAEFRQLAKRELPPLREAADNKTLAVEIRSANALLAQLNVPWDALFSELEGAAVEGVTLLAIQPEAVGGQVRLAGEAKSYERVLAYVTRLEAAERFENVFLTSHEQKTGGSARPVAFSLIADWLPKP